MNSATLRQVHGQRVSLRLSDKAEWAQIYDPQNSVVWAKVSVEAQVGDRIRLDVVVGDNGPRVILRGNIAAHVAQTEGGGVRIALGAEEREKLAYVSGYVRGGLLDLRESRRIPVRLPVVYFERGGAQRSFTRDINEQGVFVIAESPLPEDTEIQLQIEFPGAKLRSLTGVVAHTVVVEDEDVPGMGIVFRFGAGQERAFIDDIDELEERFRRGDLPEELLL